jgi:hypothetical protein
VYVLENTLPPPLPGGRGNEEKSANVIWAKNMKIGKSKIGKRAGKIRKKISDWHVQQYRLEI